jgi:hypothetical protein
MKIAKVFLLMSAAAVYIFASSVINLSLEPAWAFKDSYIHAKDRKVHWTVAGEYGWLLSEHLILGPNVNFAWNIEKDRTSVGNNTHWVHSKKRVIMLPVSVFCIVDPIPQYMIHPIFHMQVGYNSVFISNIDYGNDTADDVLIDEVQKYDGYYNGIIAKFSFECMFDAGKSISFFAGPQWQLSTTERRGKDREHYECKFNGFGLKFGVSVLL